MLGKQNNGDGSMVEGHQVTKVIRKAEQPLSHRQIRQHAVDPVGGNVAHATPLTGRADATPPTGIRQRLVALAAGCNSFVCFKSQCRQKNDQTYHDSLLATASATSSSL